MTKDGSTYRKKTAHFETIWGMEVAKHGFVRFPVLLVDCQYYFGLSFGELGLLVNLVSYLWRPGNMPFPSISLLAKHTGRSERQIQRHLAGLERKGLLKRVYRVGKAGTRSSNSLDLTGLLNALKVLGRRMPTRQYRSAGLAPPTDLRPKRAASSRKRPTDP